MEKEERDKEKKEEKMKEKEKKQKEKEQKEKEKRERKEKKQKEKEQKEKERKEKEKKEKEQKEKEKRERKEKKQKDKEKNERKKKNRKVFALLLSCTRGGASEEDLDDHQSPLPLDACSGPSTQDDSVHSQESPDVTAEEDQTAGPSQGGLACSYTAEECVEVSPCLKEDQTAGPSQGGLACSSTGEERVEVSPCLKEDQTAGPSQGGLACSSTGEERVEELPSPTTDEDETAGPSHSRGLDRSPIQLLRRRGASGRKTQTKTKGAKKADIQMEEGGTKITERTDDDDDDDIPYPSIGHQIFFVMSWTTFLVGYIPLMVYATSELLQKMDSLQKQMEEHTVSVASWTSAEDKLNKLGVHENSPRRLSKEEGEGGASQEDLVDHQSTLPLDACSGPSAQDDSVHGQESPDVPAEETLTAGPSHSQKYQHGLVVGEDVEVIHTALNHLDSTNSYVRMLFIDFSSAFNTIIPSRLIHKLSTVGISSPLCSWIMDFLTCRPQCVRMGEHTSPSLTLSTGCHLGIVLYPLLYTLYTHDCTTTHSSNTIIKFADDTTIIGNITNDDEGPYREEVKLLTEWCAANNLSLNVSKTKELIIDFRKGGRTHTPLNTGGTLVERVSSFKFLCVHLAEDLTWTTNTSHLVRKAQQRLHFLRRLRRVNLPQQLLCNLYRSTVESILTSCITVWYGSATSADRKALQRVVKTAQHITASTLPPIQDIYDKRSSCLWLPAPDPVHKTSLHTARREEWTDQDGLKNVHTS
ncbi:hypothetical protein NFI96_002788 [Prochilodus magdalenae]|nr:hypothetical protein NFI96_002788 [Prochilodus magdalenae]